MSQRNIEVVIGRLLTDEGFRLTFLADPQRALRAVVERGTDLTPSEIAALIAIDVTLWHDVAELIDPRLQKATLTSAPAGAAPPATTDDCQCAGLRPREIDQRHRWRLDADGNYQVRYRDGHARLHGA